MPEFDHDLFIVYAGADRSWVEGYLKPKLGGGAAGAPRIVTEHDFDVTRGRIEEFEKAVETSRYVLLVLSPEFLADCWTGFGNQLAAYESVEGERNKLVLVTLRECHLPLNLRSRITLDCTLQDQWDGEVGRLLKLLSVPETKVEAPECPYPGMVPFQEKDARFFHGRGHEIQTLLALVQHNRFLLVVGSSGSGKSSLVRAGLLPKLDDGAAFPRGTWRTRVFRPGSKPVTALAEVLGSDGDAGRAIDGVLAAAPAASRLLVIVDQFEELFTLVSDREEREKFLGMIRGIRQDARCTVVVAMRADFYGDLMNSTLWPVDRGQVLEVGPLRGDAMREAIVKPAEEVGVFLEDGLVQRLLSEAADEPGALPMLQEALRRLWAVMRGRLITRKSYEDDLGKDGRNGLAVAMATKADATLNDLPADRQRIARRVFLRLVQFGEGRPDTRRQLAMDELRSANDDPKVFDEVIAQLADNRLLTLSGDEAKSGRRVDIAHEMLIAGWPASREWVRVRRDAEQVRRRLEADVREYARLDRKGGLLDAAALPEAERWLDSPDAVEIGADHDIIEFIHASRAALDDAERRKEAERQKELDQARALAEERARFAGVMKRVAAVAAGFAVVFLLLGLYANSQRVRSTNQEALAKKNEQAALAFAKKAEDNLDASRINERKSRSQAFAFRALPYLVDPNRDPQYALGWAIAAVRASKPVLPEAVEALTRAVQVNHLAGGASGHRNGTETFAWDPEGRRLATIDRSGTLSVLDLVGHPLYKDGLELGPGLASPSVYDEGESRPLVWSSRGGRLATTNGARDEVQVVSRDGAPLASIKGFSHHVARLEWSFDGEVLAVLEVLPPIVLPQAPKVRPAAPGPAASPVKASNASLWTREGKRIARLVEQEGRVIDLAWSPDANLLATAGEDGTLRFYDHAGTLTQTRSEHGKPVRRVAWCPSGSRLASAGDDGAVRFWNRAGNPIDKPILPKTPDGYHPASPILAWRHDGRYLGFQGEGGPAIFDADKGVILRLGSGSPQTERLDFQLTGMSWAPSGDLVATTGPGRFRLWHLDGKPSGISQPGKFAWRPGTSDYASTDPPSQPMPGLPAPDMPGSPPTRTADTTFRLWSSRGTELATFRGHESRPRLVAWSADGSRLASAGDDETVRLWNPDDDLTPPLAGRDLVRFLAWQPGGRTLVTASESGSPTFWDASGRRIREAAAASAGGPIAGLAWSPDGRRLLVRTAGPPGRVELLDPSGDVAGVVVDAVDAAWSPSGDRLATTGDSALRFHDRDGNPLGRAPGPPGFSPSLVAWSPDGKLVAATAASRGMTGRPADVRSAPRVALWDSAGKFVAALASDRLGDVSQVAWSPDGSRIAATDATRTLRIWSRAGEPLGTATLPEDGIGPLSWSPDGSRICAASGGVKVGAQPMFGPPPEPKSYKGVILVWDAKAALVTTLKGHDGAIHALSWMPASARGPTSTGRGARLVSGGQGKTVRIWDVDAGKTWHILEGHEKPIRAIVWSPDGRNFATVSEDKTVRLWGSEGEALATMAAPELGLVPLSLSYAYPAGQSAAGPSSELQAGYFAAWRPDGLGLASAANDRTARLWPTEFQAIYHAGVSRMKLGLAAVPESLAQPQWDPIDLKAMIADLADPDPIARRKAAYLLGQLDPQDAKVALGALTRALKDADATVHAAAAEALGRIAPDDRATGSALAEAARGDADWRVRTSALLGLDDALKATPDLATVALPALVASLDDDRLQPFAAPILLLLGDAAIGPLVDAIAKPGASPISMTGATRVLEQIGRARAADPTPDPIPDKIVGTLTGAMTGGDDVRRAWAASASWALTHDDKAVDEAVRPLLASPNPTAKELAASLAGTIGGPAMPLVPELALLLRDDSRRTRETASGSLASLGKTLPRRAPQAMVPVPSAPRAPVPGGTAPPSGIKSPAPGDEFRPSDAIYPRKKPDQCPGPDPEGDAAPPPPLVGEVEAAAVKTHQEPAFPPLEAPRNEMASPSPFEYPLSPVMAIGAALRTMGTRFGEIVADLLLDPRPDVHSMGSSLVYELDDPEREAAAARLVAALRDPMRDVPSSAFLAIGPKATQGLDEVLKGGDPKAQDRAMAIAGNLGLLALPLARAIEEIESKGDSSRRVAAAMTLWRTVPRRGAKSLETLKVTAASSDAKVREASIAAIGEIGLDSDTESALTLLDAFAADPDARIAQLAAKAAARIKSKPVEPMPSAMAPSKGFSPSAP